MKVLLFDNIQCHHEFVQDALSATGIPCEIAKVEREAELFMQLQSPMVRCAVINEHFLDNPESLVAHLSTIRNAPPTLLINAHCESDATSATLLLGAGQKKASPLIVKMFSIIRETVRRRHAEHRMISHQKEESLCILTGGIAHDFNNMLVGILGKAALMEELVTKDTKEAEYCEGIKRTAQRLADLTQQLRAYVAGGKYTPSTINTAEVLKDTLAMLKGITEPGINKQYLNGTTLWPIKGDRAQLVQAVLNLSINACEAMGNTGTLSLYADNITMHDPWRCNATGEQNPAGDYVHIIVGDTGPGIDPNVLKRIFEPYYSTKGVNRGLGLAGVRGIIRNHEGILTVNTTPGKGTAFHIYLPRVIAQPKMVEHENEPSTCTQLATVLIVEDDEDVAEVAADILEGRGHKILTADNGRDAVRMFSENASDIDVVLLDMRLPDCSGADVYKACKLIKPDTHIVVSSGYDRSSVVAELLAKDESVAFLPKPFTPDQILKMIQDAVLV